MFCIQKRILLGTIYDYIFDVHVTVFLYAYYIYLMF